MVENTSGENSSGENSNEATQNVTTPIVVDDTTTAIPAAFDAKRRRRHTALIAGSIAAAVIVVIGGGGVAVGTALAANKLLTSNSASSGSTGTSNGFGSGGSSSDSSGYGDQTLPNQQFYPGDSSQRATSTSSAVAATAAQKVGVVTILTTLDYDSDSQAAGTGTILTSGGLILTNNHVIAGATSIEVTVESTGKEYTATVVGSDSTDDVAVLQLAGASGLKTATYDASAKVSTGDTVTDVGNAEGTGDLVAATGTVTATGKDITVQGDTAGETESLKNLIEVSADVVSGDSGGPLLASDGDVIGMVTAASSGSADITGYAIPISTALTIANQIRAGVSSSTITLGYPAFLGVQISSTATSTTGVAVAGTIDGTAAQKLGLVAGDIITSVDGTTITTATSLTAVISAHKPGDSVSVTWTDAAGASHTATATLGEGPAA